MKSLQILQILAKIGKTLRQIVCIGQALTAQFAEKYFRHALAAGTPFTHSGAKELRTLGIIAISIALGAMTLAQIVSGIVARAIGSGEALKLSCGALGVMFIVMSVVCRHGAELEGC